MPLRVSLDPVGPVTHAKEGSALLYGMAAATSNGTYTPISGATQATLVIAAAQAHKFVACQVTASDGQGGTAVSSLSPPTTITNTPPSAFSSSASPGSVAVGGSASCSGSTTDADGDSPAYTYQWFSSASSGGTYAPISGASASAFAVTSARAHQFLKCQQVASDGLGGSATSTLSTFVTVTNSPPSISSAAALSPASGFHVGTSVSCSATANDADLDTVTNSVAWQSSTDNINFFTVGVNPTQAVRSVDVSDVHKYLRCVVSTTDGIISSPIVTTSASALVLNSAPTAASLTCGGGTTIFQNNGAMPSYSCSVSNYADLDGDVPGQPFITSNTCGSTGLWTIGTVSGGSFTMTAQGVSQSSNCSFTIAASDGLAATTATTTVNVAMLSFQSETFGTPALSSSCLLSVPLTLNVASASESRPGEAAVIGSSAAAISFSDATSGNNSGTIHGTVSQTATAAGTFGYAYSASNNNSTTFDPTGGAVTLVSTPSLSAFPIPSSLTLGAPPGIAVKGAQVPYNSSTCIASCSGSPGQMSLGAFYGCAMTDGNNLECWGTSNNGSLGLSGDTANQVYGVRAVSSVAGTVAQGSVGEGSSSYVTCITTTGGYVECWGLGAQNQLGDNSTSNSTAPVTVCSNSGCGGYLQSVSSVSVGFDNVCAVSSNGTVNCWGVGTSGQLGDGNNSTSGIPVQVKSGASTVLSGIVAVEAGHQIACALASDGGVWCWGDNSTNQLGVGQVISGFASEAQTGFSAIAVGDSTICGIKTGGAVFCWGSHVGGASGQGATVAGSTSTALAVQKSAGGYVTGAVSISGGGGSFTALMSDGSAYSWGVNTYGGLGIGNTSSTGFATPLLAAGASAGGTAASGLLAVTTGAFNTCVLMGDDGTWRCVGKGTYGNLGSGSATGNTSTISSTQSVSSAAGQLCPQLSISP